MFAPGVVRFQVKDNDINTHENIEDTDLPDISGFLSYIVRCPKQNFNPTLACLIDIKIKEILAEEKNNEQRLYTIQYPFNLTSNDTKIHLVKIVADVNSMISQELSQQELSQQLNLPKSIDIIDSCYVSQFDGINKRISNLMRNKDYRAYYNHTFENQSLGNIKCNLDDWNLRK